MCKNGSRKSPSDNSQVDITWLTDLQMVFTAYLHSMETKINEDIMLKMFHRLYKRVSFRALDKLEHPFIFAYSALVNEDVKLKTK